MQLKPHRPTDGVYPATSDHAHAMEVRGAERLLFVDAWLVESEVTAAA